MSGASRSHVLITDNVFFALKQALQGSCRVYSSDLRLWIQSAKLFAYPDVMVSCDEEQVFPGPTESLMNPALIIEVLSKTTRNYDRGDKFMYYRSLPSLHLMRSQKALEAARRAMQAGRKQPKQPARAEVQKYKNGRPARMARSRSAVWG